MTKLYNRARVTITSTGTGTLSLGSAVSGYQTFASSGAQNGDVVSYVIEDGLNWEIGQGTFNSVANTLSRTTITQSYNGSSYGTSAISVTTSAQVFISPLAADLQAGTSAGNLVQLDGSAKLPAVDGSNLTNVKTPPGGTTGQVQYNAGSNTFGGFTVSGDGTLDTSTGALTVTKTNGTSFSALATTTPGTGVASALGVNTGSAGAVVVNGGALGTPSSGTLANATGLPIVAGTTGTLTAARGGTGITSLGTGVATALGNATNAASGLVALDANQNASIAGTLAMGSSFLRNRIINGDMRIDQRNAGASVTITSASASTYVLDRFYARAETAAGSKFSIQRSTSAPSTFTNSQLATSLSAYTIGASEHAGIIQAIEGLNTADLAWGTASAKNVTLSFWVKSTGLSYPAQFGGFILNSAANRCYVFSYTITQSDVWEQKTIPISGDTSGTWLTDNGVGMFVSFAVAAGSSTTAAAGSWGTTLYRSVTNQVNLLGTNGATFYLTGVQLEVGSVATPYERQIYSEQLAQCQRYYQVYGGSDGYLIGGNVNAASDQYSMVIFPVKMRASPTATSSGTWTTSNVTTTKPSINTVSASSACVYGSTSSSGNWYFQANSSDDTLTFSAEL